MCKYRLGKLHVNFKRSDWCKMLDGKVHAKAYDVEHLDLNEKLHYSQLKLIQFMHYNYIYYRMCKQVFRRWGFW